MHPHLLYPTCLVVIGASFGAGLLVFPAAERPPHELATQVATNFALAAANTIEVKPEVATTTERPSPLRPSTAALPAGPARPETIATPEPASPVPPQTEPSIAQPVAEQARSERPATPAVVRAQAHEPAQRPPARKKPARRELAARRPATAALRAVHRFGDDLQDIPASSYAADGTRRSIVIRPTSIQDVYYYSVPR